MNLLEKDKELLDIIEQVRRLRERCMAYNTRHGWDINSISIYNSVYAIDPIRVNLKNMPKEECVKIKYQNNYHYRYRMDDVEFYDVVDVVDGGADNGKTV